jgi:MFS family permease
VLIAVVTVLVMAVWFATAAVVPSLQAEWGMSHSQASWLTTAVQLGFVAGALISAALNLADRVPVPTLIGVGGLGAGAATLAVPLLSDGLGSAIGFRFVTGMTLACVYPPGVKLIASWFATGRGLAMGIVIAALTFGSGTPQLVRAFGALAWEEVLVVTACLAFAGALFSLLLEEGPYTRASAPLHPTYVRDMFRDRTQRLINFGYFGHMWELYAFWAWLPAYVAASLTSWRIDSGSHGTVALCVFVVIAVAGSAGCVAAGIAAGRIGACRVAFYSLVTSAVCCVASGLVFGLTPWILLPFLGVWGFAVIADSAQFSAALSDATEPRYVGTALTAQMAIGFVVTAVTIRVVPFAVEAVGWRWALTGLGIGPVVGAWAVRGALVPRRRASGSIGLAVL